MATAKIIRVRHTQAATVYGIVLRVSDSYFLNDADGDFATPAPADPYIAFSEDATIGGLYTLSENRKVWKSGDYLCMAYEQAGGSPAPATDTAVQLLPFVVDGDTVVTLGREYFTLSMSLVLADQLKKTLDSLGSNIEGLLQRFRVLIDAAQKGQPVRL